MEFKITKSELAKALNVGGSLAGDKKTTIAILVNAKSHPEPFHPGIHRVATLN